jgi:CheY-like chemotaxis protein
MIKKILVVEDSALLQRMYKMIFRRYIDQGGEVICAHNGREGLDQLYSHIDCSLIILDLNMPEMTGLELLDLCRSVPRLRRIPKIIISTEDKEDIIVECLKVGADAYLIKPFKVDELHDLIDRVIETRSDSSQDQQKTMTA